MQAEELARRIEENGLDLVAIPLLEVARALGFVFAQTLLFSQPLLAGLLDEAVLHRTARWLESPQQVEQLLERLAEGEERG
jgi:predicted glycosyl hydrolase (DUF1957 family)